MEESANVQQLLDGNQTAFEKWMESHCASIELFAIQYGGTRQQAAEVAEETFWQIYSDLGNLNSEEGLKYNLYRVASEKLRNHRRLDQGEQPFIPFEEDRHLHKLILQLEGKAKLSFILSRFHKMNDREIAKIVGISEDAAREAIAQAVQQLLIEIESELLDKRLEYLEKSYGRMSLSFRKDQVFAWPKQEPLKTSRKKKRTPKKVLLLWMVGLLALIAIIAVPVVTGEEYQKASAEKYIERLKDSFEGEIASRYATLGLKESTEEDQQNYFIFTPYGKEARQDFERMIEHEAFRLEETGKLDKKKLTKQYDAIIGQLALPSEMVEQLLNQPFTTDKEKSAEFIREYTKRVYDIQESYLSIFATHQQFSEDAMVDGTIQIERYLANKESYPEELQDALKRMEGQNLYLTALPQWSNVISAFSRNELSAQLKVSIHPDLVGYITHLESSTYISIPNSSRSYEEKMDDLAEIENTMLAHDEIELPYQSLRNYYSQLFYEMIMDNEINRIFGPDGKITEEVQTTWRKIASWGEESPSAYIMKRIVREMEASGWTNSETQSHFTAYHLNYAFGLAKEEKLSTFEMKGILQPDQGFDIVTFPNAIFDKYVEETYKRYSANYNSSVLLDVHPFIIFAMYYWANEQEDPVTMWHLYMPEDDPEPLETYLSEWEQEDFKLNELDGLLFDGDEYSVGSIGLIKGDTTSFYVQLGKDENSGWKISSIYKEWIEIEG